MERSTTEDQVTSAAATAFEKDADTRARKDRSRRTKRVLAILVLVALVLASLPFGFTVVSTETADANANTTFDPITYVDGVWEQITSTVTGKAVDLSEVLNAIPVDENGKVPKKDLTPITKRLGLITVGEANVYMVRFMGTVDEVDTSSSVGTMVVTPDGYDGPVVVDVYTGPRLPSDESSIRDAVGFIQFGDFREQTEYGKVAAQINDRISKTLAGLDPASLEGKQVMVTGALTIRTFNLLSIDLRKVRVVPLSIEVH